MTQEEKQLLLQDLCGRLPYGVQILYDSDKKFDGGLICQPCGLAKYIGRTCVLAFGVVNPIEVDEFKLYLHPMSSMTNKEKDELLTKLVGKKYKNLFKVKSDGRVVEVDDRTKKTWDSIDGIHFEYVDFCPNTIKTYMEFMYSHHLDIHGLIKKGLALEATKGMYNIKTE